jgi:hypothetical protein
MTAADPSPTAPSTTGSRRKKQALALVEVAGADHSRSDDDSLPPMAVSIAGVSTACSKDALASSAKAVRKTLAPE